MEDATISLDEAARLIGTSRKAVGKWASEGSLTAVTTTTRRKLFYRSEVLELKHIRDEGHRPRRVSDDVLGLKYKVLKLERLMENICAYLNIPDRLICFTDQELLIWHDRAEKFIIREKFDAKKFDFKRWLGVLKNLHEEEFKRLKALRSDPMPFIPFLRLCERIIGLAKLRKHRKISKAIAYSDLIYLFIQARNSLRDRAIILLAEEYPYDDPVRKLEESLSPATRPVLEQIDELTGRKG